MDHDSTDHPEPPRKARRGSQPDLPPQDLIAADVDPATSAAEEDDEARLPEAAGEEAAEAIAEGPLAVGHAAIENAVRLAPTSPGVYRMLNAASDVLYVGKAKNVRKRLSSYARVNAPLPARILRMIAATVTVEIVSTTTETEALLLEANLIKQLRPRFNVQLRDDKSFPYILISGDHWAPQILKHRGAQSRPGRYFGPFASAGAVNRTITALQRAFLIRSCTDGFFESRTRPCLLYQIRRCSGPCTREIDFPGYTELVREANDFLSGRSHAVKQLLAGEMEKASTELEFETAALYRDRLAALSAIQSQQGINPRTVEEADVFAIHQEGGYSCVEVFFFRTGQNWGNRAYFPRAEKSFTPEEVLASFLAQFYDDKPPPKLDPAVARDRGKRAAGRCALGQGRLQGGSLDAEARRKERADRARADQCARGARPQAERYRDPEPPAAGHGDHARTAAGAEAHRGLRQQPHPGHQRRRRDDRGGAGRVHQEPVPQVQHQVRGTDARRRLRDDARGAGTALQAAAEAAGGRRRQGKPGAKADDDSFPQWPDLVIIDGGRGQLNAVREIFEGLGLTQVSLMAVAKGPERDAGRETLFMPDREAIKLEPRDPVLYFIQRLRDEAHRFVIGSHRKLRKKDIREAGLQEIPGIGPSRKRALLHHFGTLKEIERASIADLGKVPGVSAESARKIFEFFHAQPG